MTIKPEIKAKVIVLTREGKGRNEVAKILNISQGSVSNILSTADEYQAPAIERNDQTSTAAPSCPSLKTFPEENFVSGTGVTTPAILTDQGELEEQIKTKRAEVSQLEIEVAELRKDFDSKKSLLQKEIEEKYKTLGELKNAVQDLRVEIKKYGIDSLDSKRFTDTLQVFRRFNFNHNEMVETFLEVQDVVVARRNLEQRKREIEEQRKILDRRLEEINDPYAFQTVINTLGITPDQLKSAIIDLMTLADFKIGLEQIRNIVQNTGLRYRPPQVIN